MKCSKYPSHFYNAKWILRPPRLGCVIKCSTTGFKGPFSYTHLSYGNDTLECSTRNIHPLARKNGPGKTRSTGVSFWKESGEFWDGLSGKGLEIE